MDMVTVYMYLTKFEMQLIEDPVLKQERQMILYRFYFFGHFNSECMKHRLCFCFFKNSTGLVLRGKNVLFKWKEI